MNPIDSHGSIHFENPNEYLKVLMNTIPDLVWLKDENGVYLDCNAKFETFFGAARDDIVGKTDYDFVEKPLADLFRGNDKLAMSQETPAVNEEEIVFAIGGKRVLVETVKTAMKDADGKIIGVLGIAREVTERKAYERSLKQRLDAVMEPEGSTDTVSFEQLFDIPEIQLLQDQFSTATQVASIITKPSGEPITKPSNFSCLCSMIRRTKLGCENCYRSDAIIGKFKSDGPTIQQCFSGGLWDAGAAITVGGKHVANWLIGQVRNSAQSEDQILEYADHIGVNRELMKEAFYQVPAMTYAQFRNIADVLYTLASHISKRAYQNYQQARFINEKMLYEEKILQMNRELKKISEALIQSNEELSETAAKAEESDRLKSSFLANMSHEIRTPLNAILGFSSFLGDPDISESELKHYVEIIHQSGHTLLHLIDSIIDISKIEAGLVHAQYRPTDVSELLEEMAAIYTAKVGKANEYADLRIVTVFPEVNICTSTDPIRLKQVIQNLLENAMKFTSEGEIEIGYAIDGNDLHYWVRDTGIGIDQKYHVSIFEQFRQEHENKEKLYGGTGIGLSVCKACIELMGGKMWVNSQKGEGSTFHFQLPHSPVELDQNEPSSTHQETVKFEGQHLLIAEDDPLNFEYLQAVLRPYGFKITHTENGLAAVEALEGNRDISLILMDIQMPGMNGLEATRQIRKTHPSIPIIAQTAYAFKNDRNDCLNAGCTDYISKPTKKADLLEMLRHHLGA